VRLRVFSVFLCSGRARGVAAGWPHGPHPHAAAAAARGQGVLMSSLLGSFCYAASSVGRFEMTGEKDTQGLASSALPAGWGALIIQVLVCVGSPNQIGC
jgi:hypothetical protein